jgi:hypothetical protein
MSLDAAEMGMGSRGAALRVSLTRGPKTFDDSAVHGTPNACRAELVDTSFFSTISNFFVTIYIIPKKYLAY